MLSPFPVAAKPPTLEDIAQAMTDPHYELDANEAAAVIAAFNRARVAGHPFDDFTIALVLVLKRQLIDTFEDSDSDEDVSTHDDGLRVFGKAVPHAA